MKDCDSSYNLNKCPDNGNCQSCSDWKGGLSRVVYKFTGCRNNYTQRGGVCVDSSTSIEDQHDAATNAGGDLLPTVPTQDRVKTWGEVDKALAR